MLLNILIKHLNNANKTNFKPNRDHKAGYPEMKNLNTQLSINDFIFVLKMSLLSNIGSYGS